MAFLHAYTCCIRAPAYTMCVQFSMSEAKHVVTASRNDQYQGGGAREETGQGGNSPHITTHASPCMRGVAWCRCVVQCCMHVVCYMQVGSLQVIEGVEDWNMGAHDS